MRISNDMDQLVIVRRLMLDAKRIEDRRKGKKVEEKSAKDQMEEDRALISGNAPVESVEGQKTPQKTEDVQIKLSDLINRLKEISKEQKEQPTNGVQQVQVTVREEIQREASFTYTALEKVEGLVRRSQTTAETDRYRFDFSNGTTFKITDKWSNRSTTVWGDPHIDVDDVEGDLNGDFQDLKGSDSHTTFMLQDGTRITFTARDAGVIEAVDIFKDNQHLGGIGAASKKWNEKDGLFTAAVDANSSKSSSVPTGDTVYAGGDGNDWFTANGRPLWGKTTGPIVNSRPYAVMQFEYREKISQEINIQVINKQA